MLDITLIREKPEWVKEQIAKLNDPAALARIDTIVELDARRRALLTEAETLQAHRNRLNKSVGRLRGDKKLDAAARQARAQAAADAIKAGAFDQAEACINGAAEAAQQAGADALDTLTDALRQMGDRHRDLTEQIRGTPRLVKKGRLAWLLPTIIRCDKDHPLAN